MIYDYLISVCLTWIRLDIDNFAVTSSNNRSPHRCFYINA